MHPTPTLPPPTRGEYDPAERMVRRPFSSPGYHTTLTGGEVHPTRDSLNYAARLVSFGTPESVELGLRIADRVVALQDQAPDSQTYGIWSWFLEEPLDKMAPPDWNWADFCGVRLLSIAEECPRWPSDALRRRIDDALKHAAGSIRRRDVNLDYTNIAIMGTYVTLAAAQRLGDADLLAYALDRLRRFYDFTEAEDALLEYNSPTYTMIAIRELGRVRSVTPPGEPQRMAESLFDRACRELATHYHPPTGQWAGPHSRCYQTLLTDERRREIDLLLGRADPDDLPGTASDRLTRDAMPDPLRDAFVALDAPVQRQRRIGTAEPPLVGTTYLHPRFAVGSISHSQMWNQQQPLVAYWGSPSDPAYLRVRVLVDHADLQAALLTSVQHEGHVLACIRLASDQALRHIFFEQLQHHRLPASDLRVRFEFGGSARSLNLATPEAIHTPIGFSHGRVHGRIHVADAALDATDTTPFWASSRDDRAAYQDLVLHTGGEHTFDLQRVDRAFAAFGLSLAGDATPLPEFESQFGRETIELRVEEVSMRCSVASATQRELLRQTTWHRAKPIHASSPLR
ncbi:MAG: hypothetical protein AAF710_05815 [Planctomycetota bacterium]